MFYKSIALLALLAGAFLLTSGSADATHGTLPTPGCELSPCVITVGNHFGEYGDLHGDSAYQKAVEMVINDWSKSGVYLKFIPSTVPNKSLPTSPSNPCQGGMISVCVSAGTTGQITNLYSDGKFTISASCETGCSVSSVAIKYGLCKSFGRTLGLSDQVGTVISCTDQTAVVHPNQHDLDTVLALHPDTGPGCPFASSTVCSNLTVTDSDEDNDGVLNIDEANCGDGSYWNDATKVPEKLLSGDQNGNGLTNEGLATSYMDNGFPTDIYTLARIDQYDCDGDGYKGVVGKHVFMASTPDQDRCGTTGWPSDFVTGSYPDSTNKVNVLDVSSFIAPVRRLDTSPGDANYDIRWDLQPGKGVFLADVNVADLTTMLSGASGAPPMFFGVRALNGPTCTD